MLTPGRKYVDGLVRIAANFQDEDRLDVDPDTVVFKVMSPSGSITTYTYGDDVEVVKVNVGDYYVEYSPNASGRWYYRWQTTGTGTTTAVEGSFIVVRSPFVDDVSDAYR